MSQTVAEQKHIRYITALGEVVTAIAAEAARLKLFRGSILYTQELLDNDQSIGCMIREADQAQQYSTTLPLLLYVYYPILIDVKGKSYLKVLIRHPHLTEIAKKHLDMFLENNEALKKLLEGVRIELEYDRYPDNWLI